MIRKLMKVGESCVLMWDSELESLTGLTLGNKVKVEVKSNGGLILIPIGKRSKKDKSR